jgi:hypothetical protein
MSCCRVASPGGRYSLRLLLGLVAVCALVMGGMALFLRDPLVDLFGGSRGFHVVRNPTKVEAYRLGDLPASVAIEDSQGGDYPITAGPVPLSSAMSKKLSTALLSQDTVHFGVPAACGYPVYGAKFSFFRDANRVDVFVCFTCDFLQVNLDGDRIGGEYFSEARGVLVRAAQESFPDDPVIQSLDEDR